MNYENFHVSTLKYAFRATLNPEPKASSDKNHSSPNTAYTETLLYPLNVNLPGLSGL